MQAVLLAAGRSSRFLPFNNLSHKSAFKIMGKMLIEHTIESIKKSGIEEIIIVVNPGSELAEQIGDGSRFGVSIIYVEQQEANGMGDALLTASDKITGDFFLLNAYHADFHEFKQDMEELTGENKVVLLTQQTDHISEYGSVSLDQDHKILELIEKPENVSEGLHYRVIGIYLLTKDFLEVLRDIPLEHYHFEKGLAEYARSHAAVAVVTEKENISLKYSWSLLNVKNYLLKNLENHVSDSANIKQNVIIEGPVFIDDGAKIFEGAIIKGPAYIGKNTVVGNYSMLRSGVILEEGAKIGAYTEVKNSIVGSGSSFDSGTVLDSIIGERVKIGANVCTANVRLQRDPVLFDIFDKKVNTGLHSLGVIIGDDAKLGVRVTTMPGIIIGKDSHIGPSTTVMHSVSENITYFTKFEAVQKDNS